MSDPFLCNLISGIEAQILAAMTAMEEYSGDGILSYNYNTGQTNQSVTKNSIKDMQAHLDSLLSRRDTLRVRCGLDSSSFNAGPAY
ncbi:hypothetical protein MYOV065v1_p0071 [Vibrio phage PS15B.2]|nr:hypothetical protein NVP1246O_04 [Vibrio phage 1.246.O._10N.261.54.E10]QZI90775.1 hypothetical protein MYOV065v1_p0071 [Vibrio phage PS15B.2]QZI90790.1 hypothetical protein MYOV066v1_p0012 [Vibrio phage PS15B.3]QZI90922.1 hypothetical protein MYOV064v1_p0072 [Vibrio phage PS15B.4]